MASTMFLLTLPPSVTPGTLTIMGILELNTNCDLFQKCPFSPRWVPWSDRNTTMVLEE